MSPSASGCPRLRSPGPHSGSSLQSLQPSHLFSIFHIFDFLLYFRKFPPSPSASMEISLLPPISGAESLILCPPSWPPVPASEPPGPLSWGHWPHLPPRSLGFMESLRTGSLEEQARRKLGLGARHPHQLPGGQGPCWKAPGRQRAQVGRPSAGGSCGFSVLTAAGRASWHVSCSL